MTPFDTIDAIRTRSTEAILGQTGLNHPGLAEEIRARFSSQDPDAGGLVQEPILEAALPYVIAAETMDDLSGGLLHPSLVAALDGAEPPERRFGRDQHPFRHQLDAWNLLAASADAANSVLVTSGTGSGKTECFLVPILNDLAQQAETVSHRLEGVQAIMLYPLNALIESQKERLRAWTEPFGGKLRFALYNGMLPDRVKAETYSARPEEVADRKALREAPPPIVVTNVTMLEYMLLRPQDAPILTKSQGKLRYVVLDEAHSYVGARAAEIALLLRRVCLAFGVDPAEVRFIATSATIGSGTDVTEKLRRFLADVSGAPEDRVHVVVGQTRKPELPALHDGTARDLDPFAHLGGHPRVRPLIEQIYAGPTPWSAVKSVAAQLGRSASDLAESLATAVSETRDHLAPMRVHSFHRAVSGVWSCLDAGCRLHRPVNWPFGSIHLQAADVCECGAPLFEVVTCAECGEPFLDVQETASGRLERPPAQGTADDFALDADLDASESDGDDAGDTPHAMGPRKLLATRPQGGGAMRWMFVESTSGTVHDREAEGLARLAAYDQSSPPVCPACRAQARPGADLLRPIRFAAPFILGTATPILLSSSARAPDADEPERWTRGAAPPVQGHQLLSFTDSRQGTARLSAKLQVASERNFVRSFVYHAVQDQLAAGADTAALEETNAAIVALDLASKAAPEQAKPQLAMLLEQQKQRRDELLRAGEAGLPWNELVDRLAQRPEVRIWMREVWRRREPRFESETEFARFLLLREFVRRPPRANSPETMGLARLRFDLIDRVVDAQVPAPWRELGLGLQDWRDFLSLLVTFVARGRSAVRAPRDLLHWIPAKPFSRDLVFRPDRTLAAYEVAWPRFRTVIGRPPMVANLLEQATGRSLDDAPARELFNDVFDRAWSALSTLFTQSGATTHQLDFCHAHVAPIVKGFVCPVTRRILDTALMGLTPYGAKTRGAKPQVAEALNLPRHPLPFRGEVHAIAPHEARDVIEAWLASDPSIAELRPRGAWTDLGDRIAQFSDYFRSAEHSAQQAPVKLRRYEREFRTGEINVLNCSTTMEMGVDIGSVSHVMMTNLPPSIANYRQRVGRAGRRGQPLSMAFTFCRDQPLEREAFRDPSGYLSRVLAPPQVALHSTVIVQRHINALLFAAFVRERGGNAMSMEAGPFFGCPPAPGADEEPDCFATRMAAWMRDPTTADGFAPTLLRLTRGSPLEGDTGVCEIAAQTLESAREAFVAEWRVLQSLAAAKGDDRPAAANLGIQLRRLCGDYLLGVLANRGVLPGHGFPTDVVSFVSRRDEPEAGDDRSEERSRFNAFPQRGLDMAIREYAPGSEVVLDGLVHRSAGVTLNWRQPASPEGVREVQAIKHRWRCRQCGESGVTPGFGAREPTCPECGSPNFESFEFLQPAGFAADLRETPHADADVVTYVPAQPTVVSARHGPWTSLFDPARGRYRADTEGAVFFCNSGPTGDGYAICLYCGRADYDPAEPHEPLVGKGGECEGSAKPFAHKTNLRLGHEIRTDVFEFQPAGWMDPGGALALAIALRGALARRLGVDADEMGFAAEPRRDSVGAATMSVFLHDKNSGGAGFSVKAHDLLSELLPDVLRILDCRVGGCLTGCPACVLVSGLSPEQIRTLDRRSALEIVRDGLLADSKPAAEDLATPDALFSRDVLVELQQAMQTGGTGLVLRVEGMLDPGQLATWSAASLAKHWADRGRKVKLVLDAGAIDGLNGAEKMQLRDLATRWGVLLEEGVAPQFVNQAQLVAEVARSDRETLVFASRDPKACSGSASWGHPDGAPVVRLVTPTALWAGRPVASDRLVHLSGASLRRVGAELDGPISTFGQRAGSVIRQLLEQLGVANDDSVVAMSYEDRYLRAPLSLRLCLDTLGALHVGGESVPLIVRTFELEPSTRLSRWLDSDWQSDDDRSAVAQAYGRECRLAVDWRLAHVNHGRRLRLDFASGRGAEVFLDQGFGSWRSDRGTRFDFDVNPPTQARRLRGAQTGLRLPPQASTYFVAELV